MTLSMAWVSAPQMPRRRTRDVQVLKVQFGFEPHLTGRRKQSNWTKSNIKWTSLFCNLPLQLPTNICFWAAISENLTPIESAICEQRGGKVFGQPAAAGPKLALFCVLHARHRPHSSGAGQLTPRGVSVLNVQ
jgi:hypothetical protein